MNTVRGLCWLAAIVLVGEFAHAGGPEFVAGASYFDPLSMGAPVTWAQGAVIYYTDQGDLSALLPGPNADAFVANAFAQWTSISTAAISGIRAGQLAEDVNGTNFSVVNGAITGPADIQPNATATPVGIVYDLDGSVTDALLGLGASNIAYCAGNSAFGGVDNLGTNAEIAHALIILNGNCAQTSSQLPDLQYHLVRLIGRVLGLDWSQVNLNVITGNPAATAADFSGFPVMHQIDPISCVPVANCYSNNGATDPSQPKIDDQAAISRLYPVTALNTGNFSGKQIFSQATARVHGRVFFTDGNGAVAQPMQGVNVVARWIDPSTGLPSRSAVVASVSGFLFCGNAGNMVTGFTDGSGQNFNRFGSSDATLEGFFDLAGLQIPNGATSVRYELTVEAVDPLWSANAGPYGATSQAQPSGSAQQMIVNVTLGGDVAQDILMQGSAVQKGQWYGVTSYTSPAQLAGSGTWAGTLSGYGMADFFQFPAQANRTLSVMVNALDELGNLSEGKLLPVVGMWALADPGTTPAPANTVSAFNAPFFAESRLDAQILQNTTFRLGIADYRGDGRPDYHYNARVLYGDSANPPRASVAGGSAITIKGLGLQIDTAVQTAGVKAPVLASSATQLLVDMPALTDGTYDLLLSDANTGGSSNMSGVLTAGAGPSDLMKLISGANPATPVGGTAPMPFTVIVVAADGVTPVAGATVQFTASASAVAFAACGGATSCTLLSDQSGLAASLMTPLSAAVITVTAQLAPASYPSPQQVQVTLLGTSSQLDLALTTPSIWIAQGATVTVPVSARVLSNGVGVNGAKVNYQITQGTGILSAVQSLTDSKGYASVNLQVNLAAGNVQVSVCVGTTNNPCQVFNATVVQNSALKVLAVSGRLQIVPPGQSFQPIMVRVIDSASPPHGVMGEGVVFLSYVGRMPGNEPIVWAGEAGISPGGMPVILSESLTTVDSDINGLASFLISSGGISGNVTVVGSATAGSGSVQFAGQQLGP